jgi:hypothetical protein
MEDKLHVVPHEMILLDVICEALTVSFRAIERDFLNAADEAVVLRDVGSPVLLGSQRGERVDDDTEDNVQQNGRDDNEEQNVVPNPRVQRPHTQVAHASTGQQRLAHVEPHATTGTKHRM